jgi:hypothetical protein
MTQALARADEAHVDHAQSPSLRPAPAPASRGSAVAAAPKGFRNYTRPSFLLGSGLKGIANLAWHTFQAVNRLVPYGSMQPKWAPAPLQKSKDRSFPEFGFPRETDSLCPECVKEVRNRIVSGEGDWRELIRGKPGEIRARIVERDGQIWMEKDCARHGHFEDQMAMDSEFLRRMERHYPGRDFRMEQDPFHNHGSSTVKYGRGAVLTVDLTNRCNMMCNPCFMDANQVGYVHELNWDDIRQILDNSIQVKPRRQMSVQFSGGEPTLSPHFLDAVAYARKLGYISVQAATNGIRFAQDVDFCRRAKAAGLRLVYLQFDGVTNEANNHRGVGNLFDVKKRALENLKAAGIDATLVVTIVNGINNDQVGPIVKFAIDNVRIVNAVSFQPVSFTGRDEDIDDDTRRKQRYTLSHLAHDLKAQLGITEPLRDWYPLSASGPFSDLRDQLEGLEAEFGAMKCGCHPNCGIGTMLLVDQMTQKAVPFPQVLDTDQLFKDLTLITDTCRSKPLTVLQFVLAVLRNVKFSALPSELDIWQMIKLIDGHNGAKLGLAEKGRYRWRVVMVAGMWFQDLFNYDFRRTEMCIIPYGTQLGEVSFCAYNTGIGWRQIVEKMFSTHSTAQWFKEQGRHPIFAAGKDVPLAPRTGPVAIPVVSDAPIPVAAIGRPGRPSAGQVPAMVAMEAGTAAGCDTGCGCH